MFNRYLGIVKWCRLCDHVSRSVGGGGGVDFNNVIYNFLEGHSLFDSSSSAFKGLPFSVSTRVVGLVVRL